MPNQNKHFNNDEIPENIVELWGSQTQSVSSGTVTKKTVTITQQSGTNLNFLHQKDKQQVRTAKIRQNKKPIIAFAALMIFIALVLQGAGLVASGLNAKNEVTLNANAGLSSLKEAQDLLAQKNFIGAEEKLIFAGQSFASAQKDLDDLGGIIHSVLKVTKQGSAADNLLIAGQQISAAGIGFNSFRQLISQVKISPQGFEAPDGFYGTVNAAKKYLTEANLNLAKATEAINKVDPKALPESLSGQFLHYKEALASANQLFGQAANLIDLFHKFIGPGKKTVLILFENNAEQRATGGFIGTYGFYKFNDGKIVSQKITSIYDLDGQIKDKIAPPGPYHDLTNKWGLRDSNWFADFRNSAAKASDFYEQVGQETPDAVLAITPDLFVDMLKITGPIYFPKYGLALSSDNFRQEVQSATSDGYDKEINKPKQLLADFAPLFLQSIADLPEDKTPLLLATLLDNLRQKNILFFDRNSETEKGFEDYNWSGNLTATDYDYLDIVNSNLGGKKTDLDVDMTAQLKSEVTSGGDILNTLTYTRTQKINLARPDKNIVYTRFYVPEGAKLVAATGFNQKPFYKADGSGYYDYTTDLKNPYKVDSDLEAIDKTITVDPASSTAIGKESGKTFFGNWIETSPGQTTTIVIKYKLPFKLDSKKYSLLIQKQPGSLPIHFNYTFDMPYSVLWYTPDTLKISKHKVELQNDLSQDLFLGIVLDRPDLSN